MKIKKRYIFTGLVILLGPALFIQSTKEVSNTDVVPVVKKEIPINPYLRELLSKYDSSIQTMVNKTPGAAIVIVKGDSIIFSKGYGLASAKTGDSINVNTIFRIGSVSKGFASALTGIVAQENLVNFNDRVIDYVPGFKLKTTEQTNELSLKHVLSHSTGLIYQAYTTLIEDGLPLETMIKALHDVDLIGKPGEYYSYQNVGYSVIEKVLENSTGVPYHTLLKNKLFTPLGMNSASSTYEDIIQEENKALPHVRGKNGWYQRSISKNYYNTQAAGGVNASITDMGQWLKAILGHNEDVIMPSTLDSLFNPQIRTYVRYKYFSRWPNAKKSYYGLGWRIVENGNDIVVCHGGYVNGYSSKIALIPSEDIGICILTNSANSFIGKTVPSFLDYYDQYRDDIKNWELNQTSDTLVTTL